MRKKKLIDKKLTKLVAGECRICKNPAHEVLDVHRIGYKLEDNQYIRSNTVVICANCHRFVHEGKIIIDGWYESTAGTLLRIEEFGVERFV